MVTMKEIAKLAGVSHGTVSNVMAKKGNVSVKKIRLVEKAAKQLGYSKNAQAQNLRKESSQHVSVILPNISLDSYRDFYTTLYSLLNENNYESTLHFTDNLASKEKDCVSDALSIRSKYIIAFSSAQNPDDLYPSNPDVTKIFLNHPFLNQSEKSISISFDYQKISNFISDHIIDSGYKNIAFFGDFNQVPCDSALFALLEKDLSDSKAKLTQVNCNQRYIQNSAINILLASPCFDMVLCSDSLRKDVLVQLQALTGAAPPPIFTLTSRQIISDLSGQQLELDYRALAYEVVQQIIKPEEGIDRSVTLQPQPLTKKSYKTSTNKKSGQLSLITLKSPTSEAVAALAPYFEKTTGIKLNIVALPYDELFQTLSYSSPLQHDLVRLDIVWLQRFQEKFCMPMSAILPRINSSVSSFLPEITQAYEANSNKLYTLPFDPSIQILFYRKDLFDDIKVRRRFYEIYHKQLEVPTNFKEYNEVAEFFTKSIQPESPVEYGTTLTYGSAAVAVSDFLPRIKNHLKSIMEQTSDFNLHIAKISEALEEYVASKAYAKPKTNYWWEASLEDFSKGESAMTVAFANHASKILNSQNATVIGKIGTSLVPEGNPLLGGGCIGVSKNSENVDEAVEFLNWVYSDKISNLITLLGGLSPCKSPYCNEEILAIYPWLRNIKAHFSAGSRVFKNTGSTSFDDYVFESVVGIEVRNAIMGVSTIDEALERVRLNCNKEFLSK